MFKLILIVFIFIFLSLLFVFALGLFIQLNNNKNYESIIILILACLIFIPPGIYLCTDYYNALTFLYNCIFLVIIISIIFISYLIICFSISISEKTRFKKIVIYTFFIPYLLITCINTGIFFIKLYPIVKFEEKWECRDTGYFKGDVSTECNRIF